MKRRVTILITIYLLDQDLLNIRREYASYIIQGPFFNCILKCPLVNAVPGNISSTIFPARRVYELLLFDFCWRMMTLDFPSRFDLCRDMSVELYLHDMRTLIKYWHLQLKKTHKYVYIVTFTQFIRISIVIYFAAKVPFNLFMFLFTLLFFNVYYIHV